MALRALLVEDSALILENLRASLEEMSAVEVVGTAANECEACSWMDTRHQACDVAIVDVFLSSGSGLGVLAHVATYARPPVCVVFTNYATRDMRDRCLSLGAAAVFDKSTEIDELVDWLDQHRRH